MMSNPLVRLQVGDGEYAVLSLHGQETLSSPAHYQFECDVGLQVKLQPWRHCIGTLVFGKHCRHHIDICHLSRQPETGLVQIQGKSLTARLQSQYQALGLAHSHISSCIRAICKHTPELNISFEFDQSHKKPLRLQMPHENDHAFLLRQCADAGIYYRLDPSEQSALVVFTSQQVPTQPLAITAHNTSTVYSLDRPNIIKTSTTHPILSAGMSVQINSANSQQSYFITRIEHSLCEGNYHNDLILQKSFTPAQAPLPEIPAIWEANIDSASQTVVVDNKGSQHTDCRAHIALPRLRAHGSASMTISHPIGWDMPLAEHTPMLLAAIAGNPDTPIILGTTPTTLPEPNTHHWYSTCGHALVFKPQSIALQTRLQQQSIRLNHQSTKPGLSLHSMGRIDCYAKANIRHHSRQASHMHHLGQHLILAKKIQINALQGALVLQARALDTHLDKNSSWQAGGMLELCSGQSLCFTGQSNLQVLSKKNNAIRSPKGNIAWHAFSDWQVQASTSILLVADKTFISLEANGRIILNAPTINFNQARQVSLLGTVSQQSQLQTQTPTIHPIVRLLHTVRQSSPLDKTITIRDCFWHDSWALWDAKHRGRFTINPQPAGWVSIDIFAVWQNAHQPLHPQPDVQIFDENYTHLDCVQLQLDGKQTGPINFEWQLSKPPTPHSKWPVYYRFRVKCGGVACPYYSNALQLTANCELILQDTHGTPWLAATVFRTLLLRPSIINVLQASLKRPKMLSQSNCESGKLFIPNLPLHTPITLQAHPTNHLVLDEHGQQPHFQHTLMPAFNKAHVYSAKRFLLHPPIIINLNQSGDAYLDDNILSYFKSHGEKMTCFIHGFNVPLGQFNGKTIFDPDHLASGAHRWLTHIEHQLNRVAGLKDNYLAYQRIVLIAWDGCPPSPADYFTSVIRARAQAPKLAACFKSILSRAPNMQIHAIAHSQGNALLIHALDELAKQNQYQIAHAYFWQAAVAHDSFSQTDALNATKLATVLYSQHDNILGPMPAGQDLAIQKQKPIDELLPALVCTHLGLESLYALGNWFMMPASLLLCPEQIALAFQYFRQTHPELLNDNLGVPLQANLRLQTKAYKSMGVHRIFFDEVHHRLQSADTKIRDCLMACGHIKAARMSHISHQVLLKTGRTTKLFTLFIDALLRGIAGEMRANDEIDALKAYIDDAITLMNLVLFQTDSKPKPAMGWAGPLIDSQLAQKIQTGQLQLLDQEDKLCHHSDMQNPSESLFKAVYQRYLNIL